MSSPDDKKDENGQPPSNSRRNSTGTLRTSRSRSASQSRRRAGSAPPPSGQGGVQQNAVETPRSSGPNSPASTAVSANGSTAPPPTGGSPQAQRKTRSRNTSKSPVPSNNETGTNDKDLNTHTSGFDQTHPQSNMQKRIDKTKPQETHPSGRKEIRMPITGEEPEKAKKEKDKDILYLRYEPTNHPGQVVKKEDLVPIYRKAAKMSSLLKTMLDFADIGGSVPSHSGNFLKCEKATVDKVEGPILPLSNSSCITEILKLIAKYCEHHMDDVAWSAHTRYDEFEMDEYDLEDERLKEPLTYWDWDFFNRLAMGTGGDTFWAGQGRATFYNLMIAAYYMGIDGLVEVGGKFLCNLMKGKTQAQINDFLNIAVQAQAQDPPEPAAQAQR